MKWVQSNLEDWVHDLLPPSPSDYAKEREDLEKFVFNPHKVDISSETAMYPDLADMFNEYLAIIGCKDFVVRYTDSHKGTRTPGSVENRTHNLLKPDLAFLPTLAEARKAYEIDQRPRKKTSKNVASRPLDTSAADTHTPDGSLAQSNARMTWAWGEVVVQVRHGKPRYPFTVCRFLATSRQPQMAREQLADYASEIFRHQHRQSVFMICVCDHTARFLRFDRGGAVDVSRSFDYTEHPRAMGAILYRLFGPGSNRVRRGHDPTAALAQPDAAQLFRNLHKDPACATNSTIVAALKHAATENWPIYEISIRYQWPDGDKQEPVRRNSTYPITTREFLVGRPAFSSSFMIGRGTKCMVAYDKTAKKPVFIKDMWRPDSPRLQTELETYQKLWEGESDVSKAGVPTCLGGGDVFYDGVVQRTRSHGNEGHLPRIHSRIVLKEICRRLEDFDDSFELVVGVYGAVRAHERAWKLGILHRDVSVGNILLLDLGNNRVVGLLADWDFAKTKEQLEDFSPTQIFRSGTWQFMSAQLQEYRDKRHEVSDDLESFIHILDWCAYKYLPHALSSQPEKLAEMMRFLYDHYVIVVDANSGKNVVQNSEAKSKAASSRENVVRGLASGHPFTEMLGKLHWLCGEHYAVTRPPPVDNVTSSAGPSSPRVSVRFVDVDAEDDEQTTETQSTPTPALVPSAPNTPLSPSSPVSTVAQVVSTAGEVSPLQEHTQFKSIIRFAISQAKNWPLKTMKKNKRQADLLPSLTSTPLASRAGSKRAIDSVNSEDPRPQKRQKLPLASAEEEEQANDDDADADDDDPVESELPAQDSDSVDDATVATDEDAAPFRAFMDSIIKPSNMYGQLAPVEKPAKKGGQAAQK